MRLIKFKLSTCAAICVGILFFMSCEKPYVRVSDSKLEFKADETEEKSVTIETNASNWKIQSVSEPDWIDAYQKVDGDKLFVKTPDYTNTNNSRTGAITVSASMNGETATAEIFIEQLKKPKNSLSLNSAEISYGANETGKKSVTVTTDAPSWEASKNASDTWFQISKQSQQLEVDVSSTNQQFEARSAIVTLTAGTSDPVTLTVIQGGRNTLSASATSLTFNPNESSQTVTVTTNASSWNATIASGSNWLTTATNNNVLTVTASRNTTSSTRIGSIRISAANATDATISVSQSADNLSINPTSLSFGANETSQKNVNIETNVSSWNFTNSASWLTVSQSGNTLRVNPTSSNTGATRTANITITAGYAQQTTLSVTQDGVNNTLSVSPASLVFAYNSTSVQTITVATNASNWDYSSSASWLTLSKNGNTLRVNPSTSNSSTAARSTTITFTAGSATPVTVTVIQNPLPTPDPMPIRVTCTYNATAIVQESVPQLNIPNWSGIIGVNTSNNYIGITNWANASTDLPTLWLDWVNGQFQIDVSTGTGYVTPDGTEELYWCIGTVSGGYVTPRPGVGYAVSYNQTTRILDFTGAYLGLPVCVYLIFRNKTTGQYDTTRYYGVIYRNIRISITSSPTTGAPLGNADNTNDVILKNAPINSGAKTIDEKLIKKFNP